VANAIYSCACAICKLAGGGTKDLGTPPAEPVIAQPMTGDYRMDALLKDLSNRWNKDAALGTAGTEVTYSFMSVKPSYGGTDSEGDTGFTPFNDAQKTATRAVFARLEKEIGLRFKEVADTEQSYGTLRFGTNTQRDSAGYAYLPHSTGSEKDGDVWLSDADPTQLQNIVPGTNAWATLVHEIGHAIGLKHPGNYNAGEPASPAPGNFLGALEDSTAYSIMSYRDATAGVQRDWFGAYDLLTLRTLYGAGTGNAGDTAHAFDATLGTRMATVYDSSGIDTLDLSAVNAEAKVNLNPGAFSSVGLNGTAAAKNNLTIDFATTIENYVGSDGNDQVVGNAAANRFTLGKGSNTADGGAGIDTAVYAGASSAYSVSRSGASLVVSGAGTTDLLSNVERLSFSDRKLAMDAHALTTAKILGAVFGKEAVSNAGYAGIGLSLLDSGMTYQALMQLALQVRVGASASADAVVTLLYTNVIGSAPGEAQLSHFSGLITSGQFTAASLGVLAADTDFNANNIQLTGIAASGLAYA